MRAWAVVVSVVLLFSAVLRSAEAWEPGWFEAGCFETVEGQRVLLKSHLRASALTPARLRNRLGVTFADLLDRNRLMFSARDVATLAALAPIDGDSTATVCGPLARMAGLVRTRWKERIDRVSTWRRSECVETTNSTEGRGGDAAAVAARMTAATCARLRDVPDSMLEAQLATDLAQTRERFARQTPGFVRAVYLEALASSLDPMSGFTPRAETDSKADGLSATVRGFGLSFKTTDRGVVVAEVLPNGPAAKSNAVMVADRLVALSVDIGEPAPVIPPTAARVTALLTATVGDAATFVFAREGRPRDEKIRLTRAQFESVDRRARLSIAAGDGPGAKVGVIRVPDFYADASEGRLQRTGVADDVEFLLVEAKQGGLDAVVLDLTGNPGGLSSAATDIADLFLDRAAVVVSEGGPGQDAMFVNADGAGVAWDGPLVIATDARSASASEELAGALSDFDRAVLVGTRTFGKGIGGIHQRVAERGTVSMITYRYFLPSGRSPQWDGVLPDIVVPGIPIGARMRDFRYATGPAWIPGWLSFEARRRAGAGRLWTPIDATIRQALVERSTTRSRVARSRVAEGGEATTRIVDEAVRVARDLVDLQRTPVHASRRVRP